MRHVYMWRFKKANVFKGKKIFSLCQGAFYKNLKTFIKQLSTFVYETLKAVKIGSSVFSGNSNHGKRRNAPLCGTEGAAKDGFHAVQPPIAPFKNISIWKMDVCQRGARRPLSRCLQCPANAGFGVFRG